MAGRAFGAAQSCLAAAGLWLLMAGAAVAQQGTTEVRGRVTDAQGATMPGVTVTVKNEQTGMFRTTLSGDSGAYIASGLVPGRYEVSATLQGFKTFSRKGLQLEVGRTATLDVTMEVGGMEELVTVSAATPLAQSQNQIASRTHSRIPDSTAPTRKVPGHVIRPHVRSSRPINFPLAPSLCVRRNFPPLP